MSKKGTCNHFVGCWHNEKCSAGINYRELVGGPNMGWVIRLPCHKDNKTDIVCDKYEEPTQEEVDVYEKAVEESTSKFMLTLPLIEDMKKRHKKEGKWVAAVETVECPVCKGQLCMSISSYNGHVHGRCETPDCLAWME